MNPMKFNRLVIQGVSYRRTITFNEGLTIISGDKTSGKSLVLSLIDYCLGKSKKIDLKVQKELNEKCDQVFLEISSGEETFVINRLLKEKQGKFSIYFCPFEDIDEYTPKSMEQDEFMSLLMRKLNINEYKLIKHQRHSNKQELETISFRDIFRYVYIHQHELGTHDFLSNKTTFKRYKNPHAFKLLFSLIDADKGDLKEQLVKVKNQIEDTNREIDGLKSYLRDKDAEDYSILWGKSNEFKDEIERRKKEKISIIQDSKNNKNNENEMYISLKRELTEIADQIFYYETQKNEHVISLNSKKLLRQEYEAERTEIDATLEINYKLVIPDQKIECPLCNSAVPHQTHVQGKQSLGSINTLNKIKNEISSKIKLVTNMINNDAKLIDGLNSKVVRLLKKQEILNNAISEFAKETNVPFLSQLDSINSIVNRLTREHEIIRECLRIHRKIVEKEKLISELEAEVKRLEKALEELNVSETYKKKVFLFLDEQYKEYMRRFKYDPNNETYIDSEKYIPFYSGSSVYDHESGGLLQCMQLSYLAAILASKKEGYASGHPGVLMLDSLSKYLGTLKSGSPGDYNKTTEVSEKNLIKDPEVYEEIYKILIELSADHQIIIVENTPPAIVDGFTRYTFLNGEKGLVNNDFNEFTEQD